MLVPIGVNFVGLFAVSSSFIVVTGYTDFACWLIWIDYSVCFVLVLLCVLFDGTSISAY